jgi:hypothetical protein
MDEFVIALLNILYVIAVNCGRLGCVAVQWIGDFAEEPAAIIFRVEVSLLPCFLRNICTCLANYDKVLQDDKVYIQPLGNLKYDK